MNIAITVAGFTPGESDGFRRAMGTWRSTAEMEKLHAHFVDGCRATNGLTDEQAALLVGGDRETHQRDLFESIERGEFPKWKFYVQIMPEADARKTPYNPFDLTKVWSHRDYPLIDVGVLELNRNPENYFAEVEQSAFSPASVVPGISHSPDKILQFRIFSYGDAHRYRLGVNSESLPVNRPRCPVHTYYRDGTMRFDGNEGGAPNYEPNSFGGPVADPKFREPPLALAGAMDRYAPRQEMDDFTQPGDLFRLMTPAQQTQLMDNIARAMRGVPKDIIARQVALFEKCDPAYGAGVAKRTGLS